MMLAKIDEEDPLVATLGSGRRTMSGRVRARSQSVDPPQTRVITRKSVIEQRKASIIDRRKSSLMAMNGISRKLSLTRQDNSIVTLVEEAHIDSKMLEELVTAYHQDCAAKQKEDEHDPGLILESEFLDLFSNRFNFRNRSLLRAVFHAFDLQSEGAADFREIVLRIYTKLKEKSLEDCLSLVFKVYDDNQDGVVEYQDVKPLVEAVLTRGTDLDYSAIVVYAMDFCRSNHISYDEGVTYDQLADIFRSSPQLRAAFDAPSSATIQSSNA